jgi:hypothetical protein
MNSYTYVAKRPAYVLDTWSNIKLAFYLGAWLYLIVGVIGLLYSW